jgi:hypothetical protein
LVVAALEDSNETGSNAASSLMRSLELLRLRARLARLEYLMDDAQPGPVEVRFTSDARIASRTSGRAVTSHRRPSWRYCARLSGGLVDRTRDFAGRHLQTITRLTFADVAAVLADDKASCPIVHESAGRGQLRARWGCGVALLIVGEVFTLSRSSIETGPIGNQWLSRCASGI